MYEWMHDSINETNVWMYNCKEIKFAFQFWETWEDRERVKALQQDKRQQRIWAIYERWSVISIGRKDTKLSSSWVKNSDILTWRQASFWCVSMRGRELTPCWGYELIILCWGCQQSFERNVKSTLLDLTNVSKILLKEKVSNTLENLLCMYLT